VWESPANWGRNNDGTKMGFDVKDYTDELVVAIEAVGDPCYVHARCWCGYAKGLVRSHTMVCRRLRKLVKDAKERRL
jgi:hypothetical protein